MNEEHILSRLRALRKGVDDAISDFEAGMFRPCTHEEAAEHTRTYGEDAMAIGEFVITDRKARPASVAAPAASFGEWKATPETPGNQNA